MSSLPSALRLSTIGLLVIAGCTAETPPNQKVDFTQIDFFGRPDYPGTCPPMPTLAAPTVDQYPNPTSYAVQPFRGTAPGAAQVVAKGGVGAAKPATVGGDGRFCIEVTLLADSPNTVTFTPLDGNGCPGRDTLISIVHKSGAKQDAGVATEINLAKSAPITSDVTPGAGTALEYINDGDPKSWTELSFWDWDVSGTCDKFTWVRLDLGKSYTIMKVKIRWAPDVGSDWAKCYTVLLSTKAAPGTPDATAGGDWTVAKQEQNGDGADQSLIGLNKSARWVALLLYENGSSGLTETFKLGELEVWGLDPNATPIPPPDSCK